MFCLCYVMNVRIQLKAGDELCLVRKPATGMSSIYNVMDLAKTRGVRKAEQNAGTRWLAIVMKNDWL